jgi:hypothetical protein
MSDVHHRAPRGKGSDPSAALASLDRFVEAAKALNDVWDLPMERSTYPACLPSFDEFVSLLEDWQNDVHGRLALEDREPDPLNLADPAAVRAWIKDMRAQIEDAAGAGEDATRPSGKRHLGRLMARRTIVEARDAALQLLRAAELGLG